MTELWELIINFAPGLWLSALIAVGSLAMGLPIAVVLALGTLFAAKWISWVCVMIVELGRGIPGLVLIYLVYFGLPQVEVTLQAVPAAIIALGIMTAGYTSEMFVSGFRAVPSGQWQASRSLGMPYFKIVRLVILPQAVRIVVPPLIGWCIMLFQATSLAYAISVPELMSKAYNYAAITFEYAFAFGLAGALYLLVTLIGLWLYRRLGGSRLELEYT
jgi:polar amino acid transport system permease protein